MKYLKPELEIVLFEDGEGALTYLESTGVNQPGEGDLGEDDGDVVEETYL